MFSTLSRGRLQLALRPLLALTMVTLAQPGYAALTLGATRIIYDGDLRNTSIMARNPSDRAYAAQVWVNTAADDTTTVVPFIPSPGLFRLDAGKEQLIRINGLPHELPQDRESMFFLNLQEIPQHRPEDRGSNVLTIALRSRIKFIYRPTPLKGDPQQHVQGLKWQWNGPTRELRVHNPSPYYFTFKHVHTSQGQRLEPAMVAPFAEHSFRLPADAPVPTQVRFTTINDYGSTSESLNAPVTATP